MGISSQRLVYLVSRRYQRHVPSGRSAIFQQLLGFVRSNYSARLVAPITALESASWRVRLHTVLATFASLLRPGYPLQTALYTNPAMRRSLRRKLNDPTNIILVDGLRLLRIALPYAATCRIILDMDDLLSRRYRHHQKLLGAASPGALGHQATRSLGRFGSLIVKLLTTIEIQRLRRLEHRAAIEAHDIIFTSSYEARMFRRLYPRTAARIHCHPLPLEQGWEPSCATCSVNSAGCSANRPVVFGFLGSDSVPQNALSIDSLLGLWTTEPRPSARLLIAGQQHRTYRGRPGVRFCGFVPSLATFFEEIDALLVPATLPGGVKIKVLDALARGCPVVGTRRTFEGIPIPRRYPLIFHQRDLFTWVRLPDTELHEKLDTARRYLYANPVPRSLCHPTDRYIRIFDPRHLRL